MKSAIFNFIKRNQHLLLAAVVIVALSFVLQFRYLREFPLYIHAWAQADWYSLSIGYVDNGMDFAHPLTMLYNKQDDGLWGSPITSADFPIHEYIVALLMKILGNTSPWVFRCYTLLISMIGLLFLYKLTHLLTDDPIKSLLVTIMVATVPSYTYYASGFIPTIPALSCAFVGLWGYLSYVKKKKRVYFAVGFAFLTLAAMIRMPQIVLLMAVCGFELLRIIRKETQLRGNILIIAIAVACYLGVFLWNIHLKNLYDSMFLGKLRPPENMEDVQFVYQNIQERWMFHYFQRIQHWMVAVILAVTAIYALIIQIRKRKNHTTTSATNEAEPSRKSLSLWWLLGIYILGELAYCGSMLLQYSDHDYYFLDSLFFSIIFLFILALATLPRIQGHIASVVGLLLLVGLTIPMTQEALNMQQLRRDPNDGALRCYNNFHQSDKWLDSMGVSRDAKIVALFAYPKSSAFIQMKRRGYIVLNTDEKMVRKALAADYDYIVIENDIYRNEFDGNRYVLCYLDPIATNGRITLCQISKEQTADSPEAFFELAQSRGR